MCEIYLNLVALNVSLDYFYWKQYNLFITVSVPANCKGKSYIFHVTALSAVSSCREESHCLTLWPLNPPNCSPVGASDVCEVSQRTWGGGGGSFMPLLNLIGSKTRPDSKCKLGRKYESKCQRSSQEFSHYVLYVSSCSLSCWMHCVLVLPDLWTRVWARK